MAGKREKGKITRSEWPIISERYAGGESLASIARNYGCTAPAIRYIVNRESNASLKVERHQAQADDAAEIASSTLRATTNGASSLNGGLSPVSPETRMSPINSELRERVNSDIAAFLVAFDAAFVLNSVENQMVLREATDRLLRAGARTRIALEQMPIGIHKRKR